MDLYHSIHDPDVASFEIPSDTHRLPTVSAIDALDGPDDICAANLTTGLAVLDGVLAADEALSQDREHSADQARGGLPLGQMTEVWGPPGVGKTTFGIQVAANALVDKHTVMWLLPLVLHLLHLRLRLRLLKALQPETDRLQTLVANVKAEKEDQNNGEGENHDYDDEEKEEELPEFDLTSAELAYYSCESLAQVIALIQRPNPALFPKDLTLFVIDGLATLINYTFPRPNGDTQKQFRGPKGILLRFSARPMFDVPRQLITWHTAQSPAAKRLQVLQLIVSSLQKLAATRNCAVLVLSQCVTKMDAGRGASLAPAINGTVWEQAMATRLVFFKDWFWKNDAKHEGRWQDPESFEEVVFVGVQKVQGKTMLDAMERMIGFHIQSTGLVAEDNIQRDDIDLGSTSKRKLRQTDFEVADSDEEEHWDNDFIDQIPRPSQWQGSEDLILDQKRHEDDGSEDEEDGDDETKRDQAYGVPGDVWSDYLLNNMQQTTVQCTANHATVGLEKEGQNQQAQEGRETGAT
ncbi:hypothetical protein TD95_004360 [Thielaviopsis punctulata]|uniref:RecA family profile 1 domain-containing protein n=1 Tax=Thielaviopsis punctulata TaxID=72032 RepID=A0A0F4ZLS6_9PEZI|nr:hypothetical protein TD95_004360 [Thielaviopsis punctulata]